MRFKQEILRQNFGLAAFELVACEDLIGVWVVLEDHVNSGAQFLIDPDCSLQIFFLLLELVLIKLAQLPGDLSRLVEIKVQHRLAFEQLLGLKETVVFLDLWQIVLVAAHEEHSEIFDEDRLHPQHGLHDFDEQLVDLIRREDVLENTVNAQFGLQSNVERSWFPALAFLVSKRHVWRLIALRNRIQKFVQRLFWVTVIESWILYEPFVVEFGDEGSSCSNRYWVVFVLLLVSLKIQVDLVAFRKPSIRWQISIFLKLRVVDFFHLFRVLHL